MEDMERGIVLGARLTEAITANVGTADLDALADWVENVEPTDDLQAGVFRHLVERLRRVSEIRKTNATDDDRV